MFCSAFPCVVFAFRNGSTIFIFNLCEDEVIITNHACSEFESKQLFSKLYNYIIYTILQASKYGKANIISAFLGESYGIQRMDSPPRQGLL